MHTNDTIVAISSPAGTGWRGIVRLSGPEAWPLAAGLLEPTLDSATLRLAVPQCQTVMLVNPPVPALLVLFAAPKSFTGQDVAELHVPGAVPLLQQLVERLLRAGARQAGPGEFSARAFFNGKMDLTQAEGIAATIAARNHVELRAATALREGHLHEQIASLSNAVANLLALIEAGIDFSDEPGVSFVTAEATGVRLRQLGQSLHDTLVHATRVDRLATLPTVVLIGPPNVGKSSLINALTQQDRAIVSPVAGTTRDMLAATLHTESGDVRLLDVPGEEIPTGEVAARMMDARRLALLEADLVVRVIDHTQDPRAAAAGWADLPAAMLVVQNKADLLAPNRVLPEREPSRDREGATNRRLNAARSLPYGRGSEMPQNMATPAEPWYQVSAKTGQNIPQLRAVIAQLVARRDTVGAGRMVLNQRHRLILQDVTTALWQAAQHTQDKTTFERSLDLLAADLRHALDLLGQISGTISPDEVLGRVFSTFCVGK